MKKTKRRQCSQMSRCLRHRDPQWKLARVGKAQSPVAMKCDWYEVTGTKDIGKGGKTTEVELLCNKSSVVGARKAD